MKRRLLSPSTQQLASIKISSAIRDLANFKSCKTFAAYIAFDGEVDLSPLMNYAWQEDKLCYVPLVKDEKMLFIQYEEGDELIKNRFGILEPLFNKNKLISPEELELVITPLVGFDIHLNRLGTGGGYYDRTFAFVKQQKHKLCLVGVAYEFQKLENLTPQSWDVPLDMVITEEKIYSDS